MVTLEMHARRSGWGAVGVARVARRLLASLTFVVILTDLSPSGSAVALEVNPRCFVNGGGTVNGDHFGGQAGSRRGDVSGTWTHVTDDGRTLTADIDSLICRRGGGQAPPPPTEDSIADLSGSGVFDGQHVTVGITASDHGEARADDTYTIVVSDPEGSVLYTESGVLDSGNFQIHATNPGRD